MLRARALLAIAIVSSMSLMAAAAERRPNVILIMTDDQGWGDVGFHGNPQIETPHLDALAHQSLELTRFYVCPVCSPTRASLMTGRYNYRTGAIDTYLGRSTMVADEVTLAEMLSGGRLPDRHLRQVAPGRQLSLAGDGPGLWRVARPSRRRHGAAGRSARRQLFRSDPDAQRPGRADARLLQRRVHRCGRSSSSRKTQPSRSSFICLSTARTVRCRCPTSTISVTRARDFPTTSPAYTAW